MNRIVRSALCLFPLCASSTGLAQSDDPSPSRNSAIFQSEASNRVVENVRAAAPGVMVEVFVKPGEAVVKGQILGHTDLDATKLQLDIAKSTLDAQGSVEAARGQSDAWTVARRETEEQLRKRKVEKIRLEWASAMEEMFRGTYEAQLDAKKIQEIQYAYWKEQYEKRFLRAPVSGVVAEVVADVGKSVSIASHVFTIRNDSMMSIPVNIPTDVAQTLQPGDELSICPIGSKSETPAKIDKIVTNPNNESEKSARLLVSPDAFPAALRSKLLGIKFDVLVPLFERKSRKKSAGVTAMK